MTDTITWTVPGRVLHWQLGEGSSVEELTAINTTVHGMMNESDAEQVHMLIDISQLDMAKSVLNAGKLQGSLDYYEDPRWGCTALYGSQNRALTMMIQMFSNIMGGAVRFAPDQTGAYRQLRQFDPSLPAWDEVQS